MPAGPSCITFDELSLWRRIFLGGASIGSACFSYEGDIERKGVTLFPSSRWCRSAFEGLFDFSADYETRKGLVDCGTIFSGFLVRVVFPRLVVPRLSKPSILFLSSMRPE